MNGPIAIIGAGGHAKVVYDAILAREEDARILVYDDDLSLEGAPFFASIIRAPSARVCEHSGDVHVAVGDNSFRRACCLAVAARSQRLGTVIHPAASMSRYAEVAAGAFIAAGARIGPGASVGPAAIVNHGAIVDHDCRIGAFAHVAPNATLGGNVRVGEGSLIGAGAVVLPGVRIGEWTVIGAGSVVTRDVGDGKILMGVPAREFGGN